MTHIDELKSSSSSPFETIKPLTKYHDSGSWRDELDISIEDFDTKSFIGSYEFPNFNDMTSSSPLWDEYDTKNEELGMDSEDPLEFSITILSPCSS